MRKRKLPGPRVRVTVASLRKYTQGDLLIRNSMIVGSRESVKDSRRHVKSLIAEQQKRIIALKADIQAAKKIQSTSKLKKAQEKITRTYDSAEGIITAFKAEVAELDKQIEFFDKELAKVRRFQKTPKRRKDGKDFWLNP